MNRLERVVLLALLVALLVALFSVQPVFTSIGTVAGLAAGVSVAGRVGRLRRKVDATLGEDSPVPFRGVRVEVIVQRALLQIAVLGVLLVVVALTPFAGDRAFAALAAAGTALPAVLTAERLLPRRRAAS